MSNKIALTDQAARDSIKHRLDQTFLVEAGAGSGKTTSLVDRMTALITSGSCQVEHMAAVTFTRKAAAELRERFQLKLERAYRAETDRERKARLGSALSHLHLAFIGTIHSFCGRLLRERPIEAGLSPDFAELEAWEEKLLEKRAWDEYLAQMRIENPNLLQDLRELDVSASELEDVYKQLVLYSDVELETSQVPYPELQPVRDAVLGWFARVAALMPAIRPDDGWCPLQKHIRLVTRWQRSFDLSDDAYFLRLLAKLKSGGKPTQKRWHDGKLAKRLGEEFAELQASVIHPALQAWWEYRYQPLLKFIAPAVEHYQRLREQENKLNFQDLLLRTAQLLRGNQEVRAYFQRRFTHLLVDEFQDTDPIQAEIMLYLSGDDLSEQDWTQVRIRPGSLFVVGDPKQSIYRFRRADIDIYNQVKRQIKSSGGEVLHLTANFRSLTEIIDWVNQGFGELFSHSAEPYQAEYVPMQPVRLNAEGMHGGLKRLHLGEVDGRKQELILQEDVKQVTNWLNWALQGNLQLTRSDDELLMGHTHAAVAEDFMILVHYRRDMARYAQALEQLGIPYTMSGGNDIASCLPLWEIYYLMQSLADPEDQVALVAALRGLFFGISDDALYQFKLAGGEFSCLEPLPDLPAGIQADFKHAWETLNRYYQWSRELPASSALERIMADSGILPWTLTQPMGKGQTGYMLQALELLRQEEEKGLAGFAEAVDFLGQLLTSGTDEELDIEAGLRTGVRIMNLHKAKGLEAPVVILANPSRTADIPPVLHVRRTQGQAKGYLRVARKRGFTTDVIAQPPGWDDHEQEEQLFLAGESVRLLYVAATRAKNLLVVSYSQQHAKKSPWEALHAYLPDDAWEGELLESVGQDIKMTTAVTPEDLDKVRQIMRERLQLLSAPSYSQTSVTETAKGGQPVPTRFQTGRGMSYGNVVHKALELLATDSQLDLDELSLEMLREEGRDESEQAQVVDLLRKVLQAPIWQRMQAASERLTELPFGVYEQDTYLTGVIDLAFREGDAWVLVDYKSDTVADEAHLMELAEYYRPQLELYQRYFEQATGETVRECGILFTDVLRYITLE